MKIEHINPDGLLKPAGYTHCVTVTGGKTVYAAGQGAVNESWQVVGPGDHYVQTKEAVRNLTKALAAGGARPQDIVKCTIYVVGLSPEALEAFTRGMNDALEDGPLPPTASTLVGVERLFLDEMLIEIDAIAVVDS